MDHAAAYLHSLTWATNYARWAAESQNLVDNHPSYGVDQSEVDEWRRLARKVEADARYHHRRMGRPTGTTLRERLEASVAA